MGLPWTPNSATQGDSAGNWSVVKQVLPHAFHSQFVGDLQQHVVLIGFIERGPRRQHHLGRYQPDRVEDQPSWWRRRRTVFLHQSIPSRAPRMLRAAGNSFATGVLANLVRTAGAR